MSIIGPPGFRYCPRHPEGWVGSLEQRCFVCHQVMYLTRPPRTNVPRDPPPRETHFEPAPAEQAHGWWFRQRATQA